MSIEYDTYLKSLETFQKEDLQHVYDDQYCNETVAGIIGEVGALRNRPIFLLRHTWATVAKYHRLSVCKLCYVYRGNFRIYTDDGKYTVLSQGDLCIVTPLVFQKFTIDFDKTDSEKNILFNIMLSVHEAARFFAPLLSQSYPFSNFLNQMLYGKDCPKFMILREGSEDTLTVAQKLFYEIDRFNDDNKKDSDPKDCVGILLLLNLFLLSYGRSTLPHYTFSDVRIGNTTPAAQIIDYIRLNFSDVTLNELCEHFHYTPSHICKLLRRHTGLSFKENLTNERMRHACHLLSQTSKPINDIIEKSGYFTKEYFYRAFKKHCGMTPGEYRKKYYNPIS